MDPDYCRRQAARERKNLERHQKAASRAIAAINKAETAATKAEAAAAKANSPSQAGPKLSEAERQRKAAAKARGEQTKAASAIADTQAKIHKFERQANDAEAKLDKKAADAATKEKRDRERREREDARRQKGLSAQAERDRRRQEATLSQGITELGRRTQAIEDQLTRARSAAPESITVLLIAGTILADPEEQPLRLDREIREIGQKLDLSRFRDQVSFVTAQATQLADVVDLLNKHDPDVLHFSGHGKRIRPRVRGCLRRARGA